MLALRLLHAGHGTVAQGQKLTDAQRFLRIYGATLSSSSSILPDEDQNLYELIDIDEGKKCCLCIRLEPAFNILGFFIILFGFTCLGFSGFLGYLDISLMVAET